MHVAQSGPSIARHKYAAPMVHRVSADLRGHCVLECQADKLGPVLPAEAILHELSHPRDHSALARARKSMNQVKQRLSGAAVDVIAQLFPSLFSVVQ